MKQHNKLNYVFIIIIVILAINYLLLPLFNIYALGIFSHFIRFTTTYVLPWVFLYWLIRLVKAIESK
ncbi:hypothetical protein [Bacillus mycoides]|uniref:hypothetical protein n=1 Tax=Bacillus mycoides TaxID=1405 RepID=UPI001C033C8E|nr:hypothetical protein [Bacillus mycoides]QWG60289.1 hypothetical protein EXW60_03960 [Bacillus mycoides]QWG91373.1 hypothetical protein EXW40_20375 [Bacillus mycoides]QWJ05254.1 hypothetical protein J5V76_20190 [Bacillus mycoides]